MNLKYWSILPSMKKIIEFFDAYSLMVSEAKYRTVHYLWLLRVYQQTTLNNDW